MDQLTERRIAFRRIPSRRRTPGRIITAAATLVSVVAVGGVADAATTWNVPLGANSKGQAKAGTLTTPTGVTSACSSNKVPVVVSWNAVANATSYSISQATASNGPYTTIITGATGTSASFTPSPTVGTYYFEVTANRGTNWSSPASAPTDPRTTNNGGNCS